MTYIIVFGYILPLIISSLIHYFDDETVTVGDFFKYWWAIFIPVINLFTAIFCSLMMICDKIKESNYFEKFLNKKLWK